MPKMKTAEEFDAEIRRLREKKRKAVARERKAERKARDHAAFVAGGLLLSCFPDGWESIDWDRLSRALMRSSGAFSKMTTTVLPWREASERLRAWEREQRGSNESAKSDNLGNTGGGRERKTESHDDGSAGAQKSDARTAERHIGGFADFERMVHDAQGSQSQ